MLAQTKISLPEITSADAFNEAASQNRWPMLCDASCGFAHTMLSDLLAVWRHLGKPGDIPFRRDFTARLLQPYMRHLAIYERVTELDGTRRYRVRLMGSGFVQVYGELTGKFLDDVVPGKFLPRWYAFSDISLGMRQPVRLLVRADTFGKSHMVGEYLCAPLRADDGTARMILVAARFDGMRSWTDVNTDERRKLGLPPATFV